MASYDIINRQLNDEMQTLAQLIQSGNHNERDRNRLATIMYPKLRYFINKYLNDDTETSEVINETLYKIFKGINSFDKQYRFTTWMYTIARNEALLWQHKIKTQFAVSLETLVKPVNSKDDSSQTMEKEIFFDVLYNISMEEINSMPDSIEKSILIDKEINAMKGNDIAEKYEMNLNTVKTKIRKARKTLRDSIITKNPWIVEHLDEYINDNVREELRRAEKHAEAQVTIVQSEMVEII